MEICSSSFRKKRFHLRGTRASALDRGGARLGGVIELGLSKYVFCDHFGFVYALALEECEAAEHGKLERGESRAARI